MIACILALAGISAVSAQADKTIKIGDYVGDRIATCIDHWVKSQDTKLLEEPFRHLTEGGAWQSEFIGKWMLGAIGSYHYTHDAELLQQIKDAAADLMSTQRNDGYISNYKDSDRLTNWDVWGRKYTSLALLDYYRLTDDKKALVAAERLIDGLIGELKARTNDIASIGLYRGMPSCSILEPVVYLYNITGKKKYLDFAIDIASSIEKPGNTQLVTKALEGVPVAHRFPFPKSWWSYENGHKAYEMMSCYVGLMELGKVTGNDKYISAAVAAAQIILDTEINIVGSGAAFECWYDGKTRQTTPGYHTIETCVTFTWMQFLDKLWQQTKDSKYADQLERTMYNALFAALKSDGSQISMYCPLEGKRHGGDGQCGLPINCCNANGPRGFAMIPDFAARESNDTIYINLWLPMEANFKIGRNSVAVKVKTEFPVTGINRIEINQSKPNDAVIAMRVPGWSNGVYTITEEGDTLYLPSHNGYACLNTGKKKCIALNIDFDLKSKVEELNGMQALTRDPLVFARDSRFADGDVDECGVIMTAADGSVDTRFDNASGAFAWQTVSVPMVLGTDLENPEDCTPMLVKFCDFGSAGNDWAKNGRYRVWITRPFSAMSQPYHKY